jgi:cytochrome c-type biogenesis protein CcmE
MSTKRSRWWPLNLRWVQIAILAAIALYTVNFVVAIFFPGTQV